MTLPSADHVRINADHEGSHMRTVIYLNKWGAHVFHVILAVADEEIDYTLASRVYVTLDEARHVVEQWRLRYTVADADVHDNAMIDLSVLLAGIEPTDFSPANN
ncbi:MAG: hypothetical protein K2X38_12890 [Gemmataceae bacterium]|nr:hypothetical protein [Gemmataceae bacterium]